MAKKPKYQTGCKLGNFRSSTSTQLFCTQCNMAAFNGEENSQMIWRDVATLTICGAEGSKVHHVVTGNIRAHFDSSDSANAVADFMFRILDAEGRILCQRRVRYTESEPDDDTFIVYPWSFQCFQRLPRCGEQILRLQAEIIDEGLAEPNNLVFLENVDWSARVYFKEKQGFCHETGEDSNDDDKKRKKRRKRNTYTISPIRVKVYCC